MSDQHKELHEENAAPRARLEEVEAERGTIKARADALICKGADAILAREIELEKKLATAERERDEARRDRATMETAHGEVVQQLAQLRADNTKLREDKERLDWLDRNAFIRNRTLALMERDGETLRWAGVEWDGREETVRQSIDVARAALAKEGAL